MKLRFFGPLLIVAAQFVFPSGVALGQTDGILQIGDDLHLFLERQRVLGRLPTAHLSHQPLSVYEARAYLASLDSTVLSDIDKVLASRLAGARPSPGAATVHSRLGPIYVNGRDFLVTEGDGYSIQVNPLAYLSLGAARQSARAGRDRSITAYQNTRGIRLSGHVGKHVFFETRFEETQVVVPEIAGTTLARRTGFTYRPTDNSYDFGLSTGVLGVRTRFFEFRFGHDRHRWGNGDNALMLSNFANGFAFVQARTTVGPFQYTNLFTSLEGTGGELREPGDIQHPFKYGAFHRLAIRVSDRLQLALFESVILAPTRNERNPGFFFTFFNPVVLYHTLNLNVGSPGNVLLGVDGSWIIRDGVAINGQFFLDDYQTELFTDPGFWKNTYGVMVGVHLAHPGVPGTDVRLEYSRARPYSYSNRLSNLGYVNRDGVLGYSLGPNAHDLTASIRSRPAGRLVLQGYASIGRRGRNATGINYGSDPLIPYNVDRPSDEGVKLLQGIRQRLALVEGHVGYELLPGLFVEGALRYEAVDDDETGLDRYVQPFLLVRWGLPFKSARF